MIRFPFDGRDFMRSARISTVAVLVAATSVASMPLNRPMVTDLQVDLVLEDFYFCHGVSLHCGSGATDRWPVNAVPGCACSPAPREYIVVGLPDCGKGL